MKNVKFLQLLSAGTDIVLSLKDKGSCVKKGIAKLAERRNEENMPESIFVPITTKSIGDKDIFKALNMQKKIYSDDKSKKSRLATQAEREQFFKDNDLISKDVIIKIVEYDTTTNTHEDSLIEQTINFKLMDVINYFDFKRDLGNGKNLWQDLGLQDGDYNGVIKFLRDELEISLLDVEFFLNEVELLSKGKKTFAEQQIELMNDGKL